MAIDSRLAREARAASERMTSRQWELDAARSAFQRAVRALHTAGATPSEIADELEIGRQQVHRLLGLPTIRMACAFCGRDQSELHKLICGAGGVGICSDCVAPATTVVRLGTPAADGRTALSPTEATCSFCDKEHLPVATHDGMSGICAECIDLCHEVLAGDQPS